MVPLHVQGIRRDLEIFRSWLRFDQDGSTDGSAQADRVEAHGQASGKYLCNMIYTFMWRLQMFYVLARFYPYT
jgi:hypothetical protein